MDRSARRGCPAGGAIEFIDSPDLALTEQRNGQITCRGAAVRASPLLGVPVGSISRMCASSIALGR